MSLHVDTTGLIRIARGIDELRHDMRSKILTMATNKTAAKGLTTTRQLVTQAGGWKRAYVNGKTRRTYASPATLTAKIIGRSRYSLLSEFAARQTRRGVSAAPWRSRRAFRGSFFISGKNGNQLVVHRVGKSRLPIKAMYGPGVGREMERDPVKTGILSRISTEFPVEVDRAFNFKMSTIKAKYGI